MNISLPEVPVAVVPIEPYVITYMGRPLEDYSHEELLQIAKDVLRWYFDVINREPMT